RACAQGCAAVGETLQAIDQYLAAGDGKHAAALLEEAGLELLHAGALSSVARWLDRLPATLPAHPSLELLRGWVCFHQGQTGPAISFWRGRTAAPTGEYVAVRRRAGVCGRA